MPDPVPPIYFGGASPAAEQVAAEHVDTYLAWGEPPAMVGERVARMRSLADAAGRRLRFGIRFHVIARATAREAWAVADAMLDVMSDDAIAAAQADFDRTASVGQRRMASLHGGRREALVLHPNVWAGIGLVRGGAGTALVGSYEEIADRIVEYHRLGFDAFIFSGYPHLEEAYWFGEGVLPILRQRGYLGDYPQLYTSLLAPVGIEVVSYDCASGALPDRLTDCDVWLCAPSRLSVYDDVPWLGDLEGFLRRLIVEERPFVGICFGHQLLAQALGGRVGKAPVGWGIGVQPYDIIATPWFVDEDVSQLRLIASHQDQVVEVPAAATVWATSGYCPNAGLVVGERAWTIQTHPEFAPALADHLYAGRVELLGAPAVARARASLTEPLDRERFARWIRRTAED